MKKSFLPEVFIILLTSTLISCNSKEYDEVSIDLSITGQPIEKYIYGQFIEHLGRCIYGGIWSEMVEDRKFYYPVKENFNPYGTASDEFWGTGPYSYMNASPWQIIGPGEQVQMEREKPYTGEQSVKVHAPGDGSPAGLRQYGLALIQGKPYTGRIVISGEDSSLPVVINLRTDDNNIDIPVEEIGPEFQTIEFRFESPFSSDSVMLEIFSEGSGTFTIGTLSIMPADNIKGWRKDVVALMKELESPVYRWPGGNFVSGYNWHDGIGDRDKRPPRKNPAWKGVEPNDVGIHEYMDLMYLLDAEAFIAVNTGLGTLEEVTEEIEYVNGPEDSEWGKIRSENGHPEPYHVKWWAVGNEMFGSWQLGHMPLSEYVNKHNLIAEAMWKVDPDARLIGVGALGEWSEKMLSEAADKMNLISEHIYCRELDTVSAHIAQIANSVKRVADAHRKYRSEIEGLAEKDIRIAMDEWNYWYGDYLYGELGVRYHHKDALGIAKGLHEYFRNSDLFFMANYAQTVNVIGCIKTTATEAGFATTAMPLMLYRKHFETIPVQVNQSIPLLDVAAAISPDQHILTVSMVNSDDQPKSFQLDIPGQSLPRNGKAWIIHHEDPEAYNVPGEDPEVTIVASDYTMKRNRIEVAAYAIMLLKFEI